MKLIKTSFVRGFTGGLVTLGVRAIKSAAGLIVSLCFPVLGTYAQPVEIAINGSPTFSEYVYAGIRAMYAPGFNQNPAAGSGAQQVTWSGTMPSLYGTRPVTVRVNSESDKLLNNKKLALGQSVAFLANANPGNLTFLSKIPDFTLSDYTGGWTLPQIRSEALGVVPLV